MDRKRKMKKRIPVTIISMILFATIWSCTKATGQGSITMIVSGSVHGQLDPCGWKKNPLGGLSRKFSKINELRQSGLDPVVLDAGDLFFSTDNLTDNNRESEYFRASVILDGYEKIGCDVINVGRYELIAGLEFLKKMDTKCNIPFVSGNLRDSMTGELLFEP